MQPVDIAIIFDGPWAPLAGVMATSLLVNANPERPYRLHVFHQGTEAGDLAMIKSLTRKNFEIVLHDEAAALANPVSPDSGRRISREKLRLGELLPDLKRVLYLDTDLIVLGDVAEIFDMELGAAPMAAAIDAHFQRNVRRKDRSMPAQIYQGGFADYLTEVVGLPRELHGRYFNSGVMLLDLDQMRARDTAGEARKVYANMTRPFISRDQCLFNRMFARERADLDPRWNALVPVSRLKLRMAGGELSRVQLKALDSAAILHFAGHKPWAHHIRPKAGLWWAYALASPFRANMLANFREGMGKAKPLRLIASLVWTPIQALFSLPHYLKARRRLAGG
jgi:lipopolysaccharide biosynthesis glycosyltransferase